jgi:hypothetical protein
MRKPVLSLTRCIHYSTIQRRTTKRCMLIDLQRMNNFYLDHFCEIDKYERGGLLKIKINILLYGDNL